MRFHLNRKLARLGSCLPAPVLRALLRQALGRRCVALLLHRVQAGRPGGPVPELSVSEQDLDEALEFLLRAFPGRAERWLTVTFDDGYDDAARYVESRAGRFPAADFILFVCPEKAAAGAGFRWDLAELTREAGEPSERAQEILRAPFDAATENAREDLHAVGRDPRFRVASVEKLRALAARPNVFVGGHTNCHVALSELGPEQARQELERSQAAFERLFGPQRHFAFPYGQGCFDGTHVRFLRELGGAVLWSTLQRCYSPAEVVPGAVLPRVVIDDPWSWDGIVGVVVGRSLVGRLLGARPAALPSS